MRHVVILAGGGGTRLWPASRKKLPKQFLRLGIDPNESLIGAVYRRVRANHHAWVVTAQEQAALVGQALPDLAAKRIVGEPLARNTAAAIGLATAFVLASDDDAYVGFLPADQTVSDEAKFATAMAQAFAAAEASEAIVTMGLLPTRPETGFGYLEMESASRHSDGVGKVVRFVEKPTLEVAQSYLAAGHFLWNGGMFFASAKLLLRELTKYLPEVGQFCAELVTKLKAEENCTAWLAEHYPKLPAISFDYAVMEKTQKVLAVRGDFGWNDVGSWNALADLRKGDDAGNVAMGHLVASDARRNIVVSEGQTLVALVGVSDLMVVQAGDAILVMPKDRAQDVKIVVDELKKRGLTQYL